MARTAREEMTLCRERERKRGTAGRAILFFLVLAATLLGPAASFSFYQQKGRLGTKSDRPLEEQNREYFTDRKVITHEGEEKRFYTDVLKDRVVLISFFYTNCPTADPDNAKLSEIRKLLDGDSGEKVLFVSVSADPERDTPEEVREYAKRYNAGNDWVLLTGDRDNLYAINRKLGNAAPNPESHIRVYLLGNLKTGHWIRLNQYAPSVAVAEGLRSITSK
jgi:protein SCO1/2